MVKMDPRMNVNEDLMAPILGQAKLQTQSFQGKVNKYVLTSPKRKRSEARRAKGPNRDPSQKSPVNLIESPSIISL